MRRNRRVKLASLTHPLAGRKQSPEHVANRVAARRANGTYKSYQHTTEAREKMRLAALGKHRGGNLAGHIVTFETRTKIAKNIVHGHSRKGHWSGTYRSWAAMISRVTKPSQPGYARYSALGIAICERWRLFSNFLTDMGERPEGMTLDRRDPYGNYEPGNCRWATPLEQAANKCDRARLLIAEAKIEELKAELRRLKGAAS